MGKTKTEKLTTELLLNLDIANIEIELLKADLHTEKNNTYAESLKVTNGNAKIKKLEGWIKDNCNHLAGCPVFWNNTHCNCGLINLLKKDNHD